MKMTLTKANKNDKKYHNGRNDGHDRKRVYEETEEEKERRKKLKREDFRVWEEENKVLLEKIKTEYPDSYKDWCRRIFDEELDEKGFRKHAHKWFHCKYDIIMCQAQDINRKLNKRGWFGHWCKSQEWDDKWICLDAYNMFGSSQDGGFLFLEATEKWEKEDYFGAFAAARLWLNYVKNEEFLADDELAEEQVSWYLWRQRNDLEDIFEAP